MRVTAPQLRQWTTTLPRRARTVAFREGIRKVWQRGQMRRR